MLISVVIPTYNKAKRLYLTLFALNNQDFNEKFEVIIVDDGSSDNTFEVVNEFMNMEQIQYEIRYIYQNNSGRATARNVGVKVTKGEYIIFLDDDRLVKKDYIKKHVESHESSEEDVVVLGSRYSIYISSFDKKYNLIIKQMENNYEEFIRHSKEEYYWKKVKPAFDLEVINWITFATGNVSIKKKTLCDVGLFNEQFTGWGLEDTELGYRLWKNNIEFKLCVEAPNYHLEHERNLNIKLKEMNDNLTLFKKLHKHKSIEFFSSFINGDISLGQYNNLCGGKRNNPELYKVFYQKNKGTITL